MRMRLAGEAVMVEEEEEDDDVPVAVAVRVAPHQLHNQSCVYVNPVSNQLHLGKVSLHSWALNR